MPDPGMGAVDYAAGTAKLSKLAEGKKLLMEMGTVQKLSNVVRKIILNIDGIRYTASGTKIARGQELGVMWVDFIMADIYTYYKSLSKWFLDFGDAAIVRLTGKGATNEMLETVITKGGNLYQSKFKNKKIA